ncbi:hypothetical protein A2625_05140 [candidate division WOR-1 bacterium RIFCSPHIGHO2_01_FULL_53_15]|uniref:Major facilitator superfamily (MFS) profile domain-containing protein n=1 Tax=candidate division WOR-1 bacterium RIFCSPHIGHO2_01_FULL_53_15 TaxID=1802564 RepID=A0A1F4Q1K2_UNCSA|nr:MAG: hypothetical protein A2625_05140 [candidate division WOR-1 bacterium RIFCSPHIGHO2_01_FULL_53_15]OGC13055.1 MAG: hypothetical protein A3D23_00085 [candidate division WOR-1 bacterium RIFCSPHIGHO2_02_FULL_53_26]
MIKKLAYSLGAVATAVSYQAFSTYILFFYVDVAKMPVYLAAAGMLVFAIWNAINDPVIGYLSDRTRSHWGKRLPYLILGALPFGLIYFLLWVPPFRDLGQVAPLFIYFVVIVCLFDGFYSMTILNWAALFPEMYPRFKERAEVNSYRQSFGFIGLLIGIALPPLIFSRWGWGVMGGIFGAVIVLSLGAAIWGSRESAAYERDRKLPIGQALMATLKNRSFLAFVFANLFVQYSFLTILAAIPFFAKYVLNADPPTIAGILAAAFLTAIPMLFVWRQLTVRFGVRRAFLASLAALALTLVPLFFLNDTNLIFFNSALIGAALAGFILISDVIIADVIDEDETKTGARREGMFFGLNAFVCRFAIFLQAASFSAIFVIAGYNPYVRTQPAEFLAGLRFLIAGLPILALMIGFVIMLFYPLVGSRLKEMRVKLKEIHRQKGII